MFLLASFSYTGFDKNGKAVKGSIDADARDVAATLIKGEGIVIATLNEASALNKDLNITIFEKKPKARDLAVFCRQFVSIISAGVTVVATLEMLAEQTENKPLANAINECKVGIQQGRALSECMLDFPKIFSGLFITMVEAGEASGSLDISFERMAIQFEKDAKLVGMIKKASVYPAVVFVVAIGVVIALLTFVIPQFEAMLSDLGTELPAITVLVLNASEFMQEYWYIVIGAIFVIVMAYKYFSATEFGQYTLGRITLKLPLIGNLVVKSSSSRLCRTLSTLIAAGVPLIDAIDISGRVMKNALFRDAVLMVKEDVMMGSTLAEPLERSGRFPPLVFHMVKIGEEVGDLEGMLDKLADYYDEEVEMATASIMAAMEPAIIVFLAVVVGGIVLAVISPMASLYDNLGNL